jgi:hypothetical protein
MEPAPSVELDTVVGSPVFAGLGATLPHPQHGGVTHVEGDAPIVLEYQGLDPFSPSVSDRDRKGAGRDDHVEVPDSALHRGIQLREGEHGVGVGTVAIEGRSEGIFSFERHRFEGDSHGLPSRGADVELGRAPPPVEGHRLSAGFRYGEEQSDGNGEGEKKRPSSHRSISFEEGGCRQGRKRWEEELAPATWSWKGKASSLMPPSET